MSDKPHPQYVTRTDQTIVAWNDVPEEVQRKILSGTMTEEDWHSDWEWVENRPPFSVIEEITQRDKVAEIVKHNWPEGI